MKLETMIKWGALGMAAATTAAGSVLITAKAVKKLETETFPEDPTKKGLDLKSVPAIDKLVSGGLKISDMAKRELSKDEEPLFKSDFKYTAPPSPAEPVPVETTPVPAPVVEPVAPVAPIPEPVPVPMPNAPQPIPEPAPIPAPAPEAIPAPIPVAVPVAVPVPEPVVEEELYTDVPMDLPYLAGKLGKEDEECQDVVITPAEAAAEKAEAEKAEIENEVPTVEEEPAAPAPVAEDAPVAPEAVVEPALEAPVVESIVEPIVEPIAETAPVAMGEPEVLLPTAEMIDESAHDTPSLYTEDKPAETFADINPLGQGFTVAMSDSVEDALPQATEVAATFADIAPVAAEPAPITFSDLNSEYVEQIDPVVEVKAAPVIEEAPAFEAPAPVVEEAPAFETPAPVVDEAPAPAEEKGKSVTIGGAVVSDLATEPSIAAVANAFHVPADNLVSIVAEGNAPMVFEFLYADMRTDATLMNVYFTLPDGQVTLPPETDKENVLAFGRNFITGNEELKVFLA